MSTTISGFLTSVIWGKETTQGTAAASQPYLWASQESDGLTFGETPLDTKPISGVRGQSSCSYRPGQNLPGGTPGAIPMHFGTDATEALLLLLAHFQKVTESGTASPYTYDFTPVDTALADGAFTTLTFSKDTGVADQAHNFVGCVVDELEISWSAGEAIMFAPTLKGMNSSNDITMPAIPSAPCAGFMQAPNIAVTWSGSTVHPSSFALTSMSNSPDKQSGNSRGRQAHVVGDHNANFSMDVWRNEDSDALYVSPFYDNRLGTLVIAATMDTSYGTLGGGVPVTMTITAVCNVTNPADLNTGTDDLIDSVELMVMNDTPIVVSLTADSSGLV